MKTIGVTTPEQFQREIEEMHLRDLREEILRLWTTASRAGAFAPLSRVFIVVPRDLWDDLQKLDFTVMIEGWPRIAGMDAVMAGPGQSLAVAWGER